MDYDTSWCPVCDRQILPKRFRVPKTPPPQQPTPAPPPSSPQSSPTKTLANAPSQAGGRRLSKGGTIRAKAGGLVRGTGRVNPNGALKRSDSTNSKSSSQSSTVATTAPAPPIKYREVIDTSPLPLYCSDECRMADLHNTHGGLPLNYRPDRDQDTRTGTGTAGPPHNHKSFVSTDSDTSTSSGYNSSSLDSHSSSITSSSPTTTTTTAPTTKISPSLATLAAKYHFPPLPPPAPTFPSEPSSSSDYTSPSPSPSPSNANEYTSGIMMAGRRLASMCPKPKPAQKPPYGPSNYNYGTDAPEHEHKIIPGWNDGSHAWRAEAYSLCSSSSRQKHTTTDGNGNGSYTPPKPKAYGSYIASSHPHRSSRGVYSTVTVGENGENISAFSSSYGYTPYTTPGSGSLESERLRETQELMSKYSLSFTRRSESRVSLSSSSSAPSGSYRIRKPRPLVVPGAGAAGKLLPGAEGKLLPGAEGKLLPGAEGKLLVMEGAMCGSGSRSGSSSSLSLSSGWSGPSSNSSVGASGGASSSAGASRRMRMRSPLSLSGSDSNSSEDGDGDAEVVRSATSLPKFRRRPAAEPRSWSYDHLPGKTYPVMPPVPRKEKRTVKEVGEDGVEVERVVEVEVFPEFKRLFNFDRS